MKLTLAERCDRLLNTTRFITLATVSAQGAPWASTVNYVYREETGTLIWYSMSDAVHSRNIEHEPHITASLFRTDLGESSPPVGLDGLQISGIAHFVPDNEVSLIHEYYYRKNFPDEQVRARWALLLSDFHRAGQRSFYEFEPKQLWLLDLERWEIDKKDKRVEVLWR